MNIRVPDHKDRHHLAMGRKWILLIGLWVIQDLLKL
jgi:hypothetical protein